MSVEVTMLYSSGRPSCVYSTADGLAGSPTVDQLVDVLTRKVA